MPWMGVVRSVSVVGDVDALGKIAFELREKCLNAIDDH